MKKIKMVLAASLIMTMSACTDPGETTSVAAATGGVIGAGLGVIIGSQTGDPGAGLVIGAATGAASGALIGNSIQMQEENIRNQDEAIERQERTIAAQRSELEELRRMNQDNPNFKTRLNSSLRGQGSNPANYPSNYPSKPYADRNVAAKTDSRASYNARNAPVYNPRGSAGAVSKVSRPAIQERSIPVAPPAPAVSQDKGYSSTLYGKSGSTPKVIPDQAVEVKKESEETFASESVEETSTVETKTVAAVSNNIDTENSSECKQAELEIGKAKLANDTSDKLFHTRRAIRLCSDKPAYHQSLGEVYLSLNRKDDALFEFQEALKYDPTLQSAKDSVAKLSSGSTGGSVAKTNKY